MHPDPNEPLLPLAARVARRIDGALLFVLCAAYLVLALFPDLVARTGIVHADNRGAMRLAFLLMPAVLVAVYMRFFLSARKPGDVLLTCIVLLAAAAMPFYKLAFP